MLRPLTKQLTKFLFSYDWEIIEIQGAIFKIAWGTWLLLPFDTFRQIQGYFAVGIENMWGFGLLTLGLLHLTAVISKRLFFRRWLTFVAFLFWLFTLVLIYQQSPTAALLPMFGVIAIFMMINFLRLGIQTQVNVLLVNRAIDLSNRGERRRDE